jgi:hypothetical protein
MAGLTEIIRKGLNDYKSNGVLVVPVIVGFITYLVYSSFPSEAILSEALASGSSEQFSYAASLIVGVEILYLAVAYFVILGEASMIGKVVSFGKTRLADWITGTRLYFFRVLGISIVYWMITFAVTRLVEISALTSATSERVHSAVTFLTLNLPSALVFSFLVSLFDLWLAAALLDGKGVVSSLFLGTKIAAGRERIYLGFVLLVFVVSAITTFLDSIQVQTLVGSLTYPIIASGIISALVGPLWLLIAFRFYLAQ